MSQYIPLSVRSFFILFFYPFLMSLFFLIINLCQYNNHPLLLLKLLLKKFALFVVVLIKFLHHFPECPQHFGALLPVRRSICCCSSEWKMILLFYIFKKYMFFLMINLQLCSCVGVFKSIYINREKYLQFYFRLMSVCMYVRNEISSIALFMLIFFNWPELENSTGIFNKNHLFCFSSVQCSVVSFIVVENLIIS